MCDKIEERDCLTDIEGSMRYWSVSRTEQGLSPSHRMTMTKQTKY